jgi:hypothetical protein
LTNEEQISSTFSTSVGSSTALGTIKVSASATSWDFDGTAGIQANNVWCLMIVSSASGTKVPANP